MVIFRGIAKVLHIDSEKVIIDIGDGQNNELKPRQFNKLLKVGDLIRHCEHGYYDIVDKNGNLVIR